MSKLMIEIPASVTVSSRGRSVVVDTTQLSSEIVAQLAVHGLTQKIADAASGAAKIAQDSGGDAAEISVALMEKARDALLAGEWTRRSVGDSVSEETKIARSVVRTAVKAKFGAKSPEWAKFTGLSDEKQAEKLDAWFETNKSAFEPAVKEEIARREALRKAKTKLGNSVSFEL